MDTDGRAYRDAGIAYLSTDAAAITQRLLADVRLLRLPLVRYGEDVTAGKADETWKAWLARPRYWTPTGPAREARAGRWSRQVTPRGVSAWSGRARGP